MSATGKARLKQIRESGKPYGERQAAVCDGVREFLQSAAAMAVDAQGEIGNPDRCMDGIETAKGDLDAAYWLATALAENEF